MPRRLGGAVRGRLIHNPHTADSAGLRSEPTTTDEIVGENGSLQIAPLCARQQWSEFGHSSEVWRTLTDPRFVNCRFESEPIVRVGAQGKRIERFLDRRKTITAEHLDGNAPGK